MMNEAPHKNPLSAAHRKKMLIAQGALFRAEIIASKEIVEISLRPEALAKGALRQAALAASAAFGARAVAGSGGVDLRAALPFVISGISFLSKRPALKPVVLRGALALGVAGIAAALAYKWKARAASR